MRPATESLTPLPRGLRGPLLGGPAPMGLALFALLRKHLPPRVELRLDRTELCERLHINDATLRYLLEWLEHRGHVLRRRTRHGVLAVTLEPSTPADADRQLADPEGRERVKTRILELSNQRHFIPVNFSAVAEDLGVAYGTVVAAMAELVRDGVLLERKLSCNAYQKPGKG